MEHQKYQEYEIKLKPGDKLFVYTDGVPEATDANEELFGTDRMLEALNRNPEAAPEEQLKAVRQSVDDFVGEAPQFDDMTMLGFCYYGPQRPEKTEASGS
jgi:sigma-B regulation protein RsbU (phosphoserine phosphatase)